MSRFRRWLVVAFAGLALVGVLAMVFRQGRPPMMDLIRRFNRRWLNPVVLKMAGRRHIYASVVHHVGRVSGKQYATPVVAEQVDGRFYIPLPYGTEVDWLKNTLAAGSCTLRRQGATHFATDPEVVSADLAATDLPSDMQRRFRFYGVDQYLRLTSAPPLAANRRHASAGQMSTNVERTSV